MTPKAGSWTRKHLLGLEDVSAEEIVTVLDTAGLFKKKYASDNKRASFMSGKAVAMLFFEPSTRTSTSFSLAARRVGADVTSISKATSSATKGESLSDTVRNIEVMGVDLVVLRHSAPGAPHLLARTLGTSVVNAGDGAHEHPTQGLLDIFTIRENKGRIKDLTVAIVGDISHSRVARSNIWGLKKLGARVIVVGPSTFIPNDITDMGVEVSCNIEKILPECDVLNMLRVQIERKAGEGIPSIREYTEFFGLNARRLAMCRDDVLVMHPGPMNRGVEITSDVAESAKSVILEQVKNGVAVRMAVLCLVANVSIEELYD